MKKRIVWIDILRIIGMIGVIIIHVVGNTINTFGLNNNITKSIYLSICNSCYFTLPLFVIISGSLLLNKDITYKEIFNKYIKKILLVIIFIGGIFACMEEYYINRTINFTLFKNVLMRIISGSLWEHMWYLYLVIALYLITPILRAWCKKSSQKEQKNLLIILFIMTVLKPDLCNLFQFQTAFYIPFTSGFIFAYLLGNYLYNYRLSSNEQIILYISGILSIITIIVLTCLNIATYLVSYTSVLTIIVAINVYTLVQKINIKSDKTCNIINTLGKCSFGIYIFHQLFINIIYKLLKFNIIISYPYICLILYVVIIFTITFIFVYLLRKIEFIKNNFL